jgi:putative peptidoglycan lipid II flippase
VPQFLRLRECGDRDGADRLVASVAGLSLVIFSAVAGCLALAKQPVLGVVTAGFSVEKAELTREFYLILLPCILIQGWTALIGQLINARERFALVALAPVLRPLAVIAFLALPAASANPLALALGYLLGSLLEAAVVWPAAMRAGIPTRPRWHGLDASVRAVLREFRLVAVSSLIVAAIPLADQYLAALLESGSVAALNYGGKIAGLVTALGAAPLAIAILPQFSSYAGRGEWKGLRSVLVHWTVLAVVGGTLVAAVAAAYSEPIIRLLFERGQFSSTETAIVARVQAYYILQTPFYLCGVLFGRAMIVLQNGRLLVVFSALSLAVNVLASLVFMRWLGVAGIAAAISLGLAVGSVSCGYAVFSSLRRRGA